MNPIKDPALQTWVRDYVARRLDEVGDARRSATDLRSAWKAMNEGDWAAFRELLELRETARARDIEPGEIELAVSRELKGLPRVRRDWAEYDAPYSYGVEVRVLRRLLGRAAPPERVKIQEIDWRD